MMKYAYILFAISLLSIFSAHSQWQGKNAKKELEVGIEEHLGEFLPDDILLINEEGKTQNLTSLIDKPTLLTLVYYRCASICSPLMNNIADLIQRSDITLGKDYQVITLSFNPDEGSTLSRKKKKSYMNLLQNDLAVKNWNFFTADSLNISKITESVGFKYKRTANDFFHTATIIAISPKGKITRYLNGLKTLPFEMKMAVIESQREQESATVTKILDFCYTYDPKGQTYVLNITQVIGSLIVIAIFSLFVGLVLKSYIRKRKLKISVRNN